MCSPCDRRRDLVKWESWLVTDKVRRQGECLACECLPESLQAGIPWDRYSECSSLHLLSLLFRTYLSAGGLHLLLQRGSMFFEYPGRAHPIDEWHDQLEPAASDSLVVYVRVPAYTQAACQVCETEPTFILDRVICHRANTKAVLQSGWRPIILHTDHCRERMKDIILVTDRDRLCFKTH